MSMLRCHREKGFVLLIVLVLMQVLVLLNGQALESLILLKRFNANMLVHETLYRQSVGILKDVERSIEGELPSCMIPFTAPGLLVKKPLTWWEEGATCAGNFQAVKYYYVIEFLAIDPCALIEQANAGYFRVTLFLRSNDRHLLLQSVLTRPVVDKTKICKGLPHRVELGRQSWGELN